LSAEIKKQEDAEAGYFATYQLYHGGGPVGEKINIPKDFLVRSGSVEKCIENDKPIEGLTAGDKYLDFVVNAISDEEGDAKHIYIDVKDLVDVYTGGSTDSVSVAVGDGNEISAVVLEKGVTKEMLADGVNDLISSQWLSARDYADVKIRGLSTENLTCPAGKTVSAVTEASGVIGVSFQDISITSA
jgi:molybdopterin-binding protein